MVPTSSTVHVATWLAWIPATPGSNLQCCSQQRERVRSELAAKADMNREGYRLSVDTSEQKQTTIKRWAMIYKTTLEEPNSEQNQKKKEQTKASPH